MTSQSKISQASAKAIEMLDGIARAAARPLLIAGCDAATRSAVLECIARAKEAPVTFLSAPLASELMGAEHRADSAIACARLLEAGARVWILDHIELLFSPMMRPKAIDTLIRLSRQKAVCAAWPGQVGNGRLRYARQDHPEHVDEDARRAAVLDLATFRD